MAEKQEAKDSFEGLPLANQIGGPLQAAQNAQTMLDPSTADFVQTVGTHSQEKTNGAAPNAFVPEPPVISKVPIPDLEIDQVNIRFEEEVAASEERAAAAASQEDPLRALEMGAALSAPLDWPSHPRKHS